MKKGNKMITMMLIILLVITHFSISVFAATKPGKVTYNSIQATSIEPYAISLKWSKASDAKKYKIAYKRSVESEWTYKEVNTTSIKVQNLYPNTTYSVKIQAINGREKSGWTSAKSFKTKQTPYTKTYSPKSVVKKHIVAMQSGGWLAVEVNTHITEYFCYDGNYKKFGYRCYGTTFSSLNEKSLLNNLECGMHPVEHYTAYVKDGKTKYNEKICNEHRCKHDHIYGETTFRRIERDSTTVVSHKKNTSGYISISYFITGPLVYSISSTAKFSNVAK